MQSGWQGLDRLTRLQSGLEGLYELARVYNKKKETITKMQSGWQGLEGLARIQTGWEGLDEPARVYYKKRNNQVDIDTLKNDWVIQVDMSCIKVKPYHTKQTCMKFTKVAMEGDIDRHGHLDLMIYKKLNKGAMQGPLGDISRHRDLLILQSG